jgi:hypothetical protein
MTGPQGAMPSPPFPDPNSAVLKLIVENAINAMNSGRQPPKRRSCMRPCTAGTKDTSRARTPAPAATSVAAYPNSRDPDIPAGPDLTATRRRTPHRREHGEEEDSVGSGRTAARPTRVRNSPVCYSSSAGQIQAGRGR